MANNDGVDTSFCVKMFPKVIIIILNWNGWRDTVECVESVLIATYPNFEAVIVDNGSPDDSVAILSAHFPQVSLLQVPENRYYAGGNNVGIRYALAVGADYIMLLNNDTVVHPDFLNSLVAAMEKDATLAAVGGTLYYYGPNNLIQNTGGHINFKTGHVYTLGDNEEERNQFSQPREVDFICGAAILLRSAVIEKIGLLDEALKLYAEESDWCLRAKKNGYRIMFIPNSRVMHKGAVSSETIKPLATYLANRNKIWLVQRYAHLRQKIYFHITGFLYRHPKLIMGRLLKKEFTLFFPTLKGLIDGYTKRPQ